MFAFLCITFVMNQLHFLASSHPAEPPRVNMPTVVRGFYMQPATIDCSVESDLPYRLRFTKGGSTIGEERTYEWGSSLILPFLWSSFSSLSSFCFFFLNMFFIFWVLLDILGNQNINLGWKVVCFKHIKCLYHSFHTICLKKKVFRPNFVPYCRKWNFLSHLPILYSFLSMLCLSCISPYSCLSKPKHVQTLLLAFSPVLWP